jgi:hypothetical protein
MYLLAADPAFKQLTDEQIAPMRSGVCVMSTSDLAAAPHGVLAAWETKEQIYWSQFNPAHVGKLSVHPVPGRGGSRKHPAIACNGNGDVLIAWAEGTGWNRGGSVAWQLYDSKGVPTASGKADGLPTWSEPAVFSTSDGGFAVAY